MRLKYVKHFLGDSLLKNSIYLIATNFVTGIIGFFFWIIAARYYSPDDIGITSALFSSIMLISMVGSLGLSRALTFYLPREKNTDKILSSSLAMIIISSILFSSIFIIGLKFWSPKLLSTLDNIENILIFIIVTTLISISTLIGAAFTAGRRSSFQMFKEATYHIAKILPLIFFINLGAMGIIASLSIGIFISLTLGFFLLFKTWKYIPILTLDPIIKSMAKFSAGNYVADILNNVPRSIFSIMILDILSEKSAGFFYIAITMAGLLYAIPQSISSSLLVESSDEDKFWSNVNKSIKFNMVILIPGLFLFLFFGKYVLNIFNASYAENSTISMIILALAGIPLSMVNIYNTVKNAQNSVTSLIKMNLLIAIISLALSALLIRSMNIEGVAISYLMANTVGALIVISRLKNPREFALNLINDIKIYGTNLFRHI